MNQILLYMYVHLMILLPYAPRKLGIEELVQLLDCITYAGLVVEENFLNFLNFMYFLCITQGQAWSY